MLATNTDAVISQRLQHGRPVAAVRANDHTHSVSGISGSLNLLDLIVVMRLILRRRSAVDGEHHWSLEDHQRSDHRSRTEDASVHMPHASATSSPTSTVRGDRG